MATYLSLNGSSDYVRLWNSHQISKVVIANKIYSNTNGRLFDIAYNWFAVNGSGNDSFPAYWHDVYVDGNRVVSGTDFIKSGEKVVIEANSSPTGTNNQVWFFRGWNNSAYVKVDVWDIKLYNGETLLAHYDMSTGTVLDQSGNGNHAELVGGTWLDDGTGGDTGTTGSIQYDTKNMIYAENSFQSDFRQKLYKLALSNLDTTQKLFTVDATNYDAKQVIYQTASILYDTLQNIFDGGLIGSTSYDLKLQLYAQGSQLNDMKAEIYKLHVDDYSLHQAIYKASTTDGDIHLILYADNNTKYDMAQSIYQEDIKVNYDTKQTIFDPTNSVIGIIKLSGQRDLYVHLVGKRELSVNLTGKRELEIRLRGGL